MSDRQLDDAVSTLLGSSTRSLWQMPSAADLPSGRSEICGAPSVAGAADGALLCPPEVYGHTRSSGSSASHGSSEVGDRDEPPGGDVASLLLDSGVLLMLVAAGVKDGDRTRTDCEACVERGGPKPNNESSVAEGRLWLADNEAGAAAAAAEAGDRADGTSEFVWC